MRKYAFILLVFIPGYLPGGFNLVDAAGTSQIQIIEETVRLTDSRPAVVNDIECTVYTFQIESQGIPARQATVNAYKQTGSKGSVVLTTGGPGANFYSARSPEAVRTLDILYENGYEVYEVKWDGERGWATNARGRGFHVAVGAFTELVKYMHKEIFDNSDNVIAHGNSGGAFQIAYGLAIYGLDEILSMAVMTGGPPTSDIKTAVFATDDLPERWPARAGGRSFTDYIMGWDGEGDYCVKGEAPDHIKNQLDTVSLVTNLQPRKFHYNTYVNFVQSEDPTKAHEQARIYYEAITSGKSYYYLPQVTTHNVPSSAEGASKIRELILNF